MTQAQKTAKSLHQLVILFVVLGILGTLGFVLVAIESEEGSMLWIVELLVFWIVLVWMTLVAQGVAYLLDPNR